MVLLQGQRREIAPVVHGDTELLPLATVIEGLGIRVHSDPAGGAVTLSYQGREAALYNKKSLASVGGELRLLSSPALYEEGRWLIPVDGLPRVLGPLLGQHVEWRPAPRVVIVGNVPTPRVGVTTFVTGEQARVVFEASEKVPFKVLQEPGRVTVSVGRDVVDTTFSQERLTGGIVDLVQFVGGKDNVFAVTLGKRFQNLKAYEQDGPARLVLEFQANAGEAKAERAAPAGATPRPAPAEAATLRTVVIDPGHGGDEVGAKGPGGTLEKDVTLSIARRLRAALTNSMGLQVFLTRDRDLDVGLDDRTAIANNYKADLFLSIHANASRAHGAKGCEVYFLSYQASDDESRRVALAEGGPPASAVPAGAPNPDVALILWEMAQADHLEQSSALASRIQEELADATGSGSRGVKQAPFRVLVGAAMPAVLVEVAFISNPEEEKLLSSDAFQGQVVTALVKGISRFQTEWARRTAKAERPGS